MVRAKRFWIQTLVCFLVNFLLIHTVPLTCSLKLHVKVNFSDLIFSFTQFQSFFTNHCHALMVGKVIRRLELKVEYFDISWFDSTSSERISGSVFWNALDFHKCFQRSQEWLVKFTLCRCFFIVIKSLLYYYRFWKRWHIQELYFVVFGVFIDVFKGYKYVSLYSLLCKLVWIYDGMVIWLVCYFGRRSCGWVD